MPFDIYSKDGADDVFVRTVNSTGPDEAGNVVVSGGGAVDSVNGQTGEVVLDSGDIGAAPAPTGTPDGTKFYRDDATWATPAGGGTVVSVDGVPQETLDIDSTPLTAADVGAIPTGARGTANGVASLDAGGKVPVSELPGGGTGTSGGTMPIAPGMYYTPSNHIATLFTMVPDTAYTIMFNPTAPVTLDQLGCSVLTAGESGAVLRLGVYDDAGGYPGSLIAEGTIAADAVGSPNVPVSIATTGPFWLVVVAQNCPVTPPQTRTLSGYYIHVAQNSIPSGTTGTSNVFVPTGITGALPATYPAAAPATTAAPRAWVHAASS